MKQRTKRIEEIYNDIKRELIDIPINNILLPKDKKIIKYDASYQRNYIWNSTKAINLIETVLINGVIPPITVIDTKEGLEIIDGRQRYETLLNFYNNKFPLRHFGLDILKDLDGLYYKDLANNLKTLFLEYQMKLIHYIPNNFTSEKDIELIKRDLFKRSNFGMTALTTSEIARAKYLYDFITNKLIDLFEKDKNFYDNCVDMLLPKTKRSIDNRERINLLLVAIRESLIMTYIPLIGEKTIKVGSSVFDKYYFTFITNLTEKQKLEKMDEIIKILKKLHLVKQKLTESNNDLQDNTLFFKCLYWMFTILYKEYPNSFYDFNIDQLCHYVESNGRNYFDNYKNINAIDIEARYSYVKNYITEILKLDISNYLSKTKKNRKLVSYKPIHIEKNLEVWTGIGSTKQVMAVNDTLEIREILRLIKENRFIVRSAYQRTEVKSRRKASRIIESIILGVKLPPIYLYVTREEDRVNKYTVIDGQQRLISILKFMGENITDDNYGWIHTYKNKYALCGLKDLDGLNGYVYGEGKDNLNPFKKQYIENYKFDVVKIDMQANPDFNSVDMFLRLNQNPCPISANSFEMWNSFDIINTLNKIKSIAKYSLFNQNGNKMKEEELVTTLAYMDYLDININSINDFFLVYLYTENSNKQFEHTEVKMSVKNKNALSDFLEDLESNSNEEIEFQKCVDNVSTFAQKLKILSNGNDDILLKIFNPNIEKPRKGNKKDFYIAWLILRDLDSHIIETYRDEILIDLEKAFKLMKNMPNSKTTESFINHIKDIVEKYSKYSSNIF